MKTQLFFIYIRAVNAAANMIPFFLIKSLLLRLLNVRLQRKSAIHSGVRLFGLSKVLVGEHSTINFGVYLDNRASIFIGRNVSIAHNVKIYTAGHKIDSDHFEFYKEDVYISDYVCIFANAMIMPGVRIGKGAVILPGSVVTKDVPDMAVAGGNPASVIRERKAKLAYTLDYRFWAAN